MAWRLTKALCLRVIPDETGALKSLLDDLSDDTVHRFDFVKVVILSHEAVHSSQFLEKIVDRFVAFCLSDYDLHGIMTSEYEIGLREKPNVLWMQQTAHPAPSLRTDVSTQLD
jgi:hypothetical protein